MDFALNESQKAWQMKARKFAAEEIAPLSLERDAIADPRHTWTWDIIKKGSKLGFRTAVVSKEFGGHGIDFVTQALVMAELAKADSAMSKAFSQCWKWSHLIATVCTEDQKKRFLKAFIEDDTYVLGKGITEPNGGSDNRIPIDDPKAGVRLSAVRDGDHWILNGEKTFIANGGVGKLFFLDARTDSSVPIRDGVTLFLIPADTPGFRFGKQFNKSGWRFYMNAELIFENARVPHANVIGEVNGAYRKSSGDTSGGDLFGDLELAANAVGVCDAACEQSVKLANTATQGGHPLKEQQLIQLRINRMMALTESLRALVLKAAWEHDNKVHAPTAALAMNLSTDIIQEVAEANLTNHDDAGCELVHAADKLVRDSFIWSHLAGDSVQRMRTVRRILK
jgi:alkylation response protein AidB-like acyl-CoA dehydrogenase